MVTVAGDLEVKPLYSDDTVVLTVLAGVWYPLAIEKLIAAGTTATGILVVW